MFHSQRKNRSVVLTACTVEENLLLNIQTECCPPVDLHRGRKASLCRGSSGVPSNLMRPQICPQHHHPNVDLTGGSCGFRRCRLQLWLEELYAYLSLPVLPRRLVLPLTVSLHPVTSGRLSLAPLCELVFLRCCYTSTVLPSVSSAF